MVTKCSKWFVMIPIIICAFLSGCGTKELPQGPGAVWHLVVIGDSSLWGVGEAFAARIEQDVGVQVELADFAFSVQSAGQILEVLQTGETDSFQLQDLPSALKEAEVVVMFVNPNDSLVPDNPLILDRCFEPHQANAQLACDPVSFEQWTTDLKTIWAEILALRKGQETIIRAVDIYNPLLSAWNQYGVFDLCNQCWLNQTAAVRLAAQAYNIPFLSRYDAMNGPDHNEDPVKKGFIRDDGEHLTDRGAQYVAELLAQLGYEPVPPP